MRPQRLPKVVIETHNLSSHPERLQKTGIQEVVFSILRSMPEVRRRFAGRAELLCLPQVIDEPGKTPPFAPALNNASTHLAEAERLIGAPSREIWGFDLASGGYRFGEEELGRHFTGADWLLVTSHLDPRRLSWHFGRTSPGMRTAAIFYDTIPQLFPELVPPRIRAWYVEELCPALADSASVLFPISRSAGFDLERFCLNPRGKHPEVHSRHLCLERVAPGKPLEFPGLADRSYFLLVGSTDPRKNTLPLLQAYLKALDLYPRLSRESALAIVGPQDWHFAPIVEAIGRLRERVPVLVAGYLPDAELHRAVADSAAVLMPSRYEGYGLPLALAGLYGKPTLAGLDSSLPEAARLSGAFAAPWLADELAVALNRLLETPSRAAKGPLGEPEDSWVAYVSDLLEIMIGSDTNS